MPRAELRHDVNDVDWLLHPPYWFIHALPWPGGQLAEGAIAFAPTMIPRDGLSYDAQQILGCADLIARRRHERVVFFSDITRLLARGCTSWGQLGVDWEQGLQELADRDFPALHLAITQRAYVLICTPASRMFTLGTDVGLIAMEGDERKLVRRSFAKRLDADWPPFMRAVIDAASR